MMFIFFWRSSNKFTLGPRVTPDPSLIVNHEQSYPILSKEMAQLLMRQEFTNNILEK